MLHNTGHSAKKHLKNIIALHIIQLMQTSQYILEMKTIDGR